MSNGTWEPGLPGEYSADVEAHRKRLREECRWPQAFCSEPISTRYPNLVFCQSHILHVWGTVQTDLDDREETAAQMLDPATRLPALLAAAHEARCIEVEQKRKARKVKPGTVYFIRVGSDYKIGWSGNFYNRIRQYPPTAQVLATQPGSRADERALHTRFSEYRVGGREWYRRAPAITEHIRSVADKHGVWDPRDPIEVNRKTPQERTVESMRWDGKGNGPAV